MRKSMSNEVYHGERAHCSSSNLKTVFTTESAERMFRERAKANIATPAMQFGSAFHSYILEPGSFDDEFVSLPETYVNDKGEEKKWNLKAKICKDIYAELIASGKQILPKTTPAKDKSMPIMDAFDKMRDNIYSTMFADYLNSPTGEAEVSIFNDKDFGTPVKIRPDFLDVENGLMISLKTADDASERAFGKKCSTMSYDLAEALYNDVLEKEYGKKFDILWLVCENTGGFKACWYKVSEEVIKKGRAKYQRAIEIIKDSECPNLYGETTYKGYKAETEIIEIKLPW